MKIKSILFIVLLYSLAVDSNRSGCCSGIERSCCCLNKQGRIITISMSHRNYHIDNYKCATTRGCKNGWKC
jgi:hypothetical protein